MYAMYLRSMEGSRTAVAAAGQTSSFTARVPWNCIMYAMYLRSTYCGAFSWKV